MPSCYCTTIRVAEKFAPRSRLPTEPRRTSGRYLIDIPSEARNGASDGGRPRNASSIAEPESVAPGVRTRSRYRRPWCASKHPPGASLNSLNISCENASDHPYPEQKNPPKNNRSPEPDETRKVKKGNEIPEMKTPICTSVRQVKRNERLESRKKEEEKKPTWALFPHHAQV